MTKLNNVVIKDGFVYGLSDGVLQCVDLENGNKRGPATTTATANCCALAIRCSSPAKMASWRSSSRSQEFHELAKFQAIER